MHERKSRLFEKFDRTPLTRGTASAAPSVVIRAAKAVDAAEIGQISADREGRDLFDAVADVRRALNDPKMGHDRLLLVAEFRDCVVGFGKVQSLGAKGTTNECALPCGWYLTGIVVDPAFRRRGVGARLTAARLQWIAERSSTAYYLRECEESGQHSPA